MNEKPFKGKAIYTPTGAAGEYAKWACNFFKGCSCAGYYCYNRRWDWGNVPTLKKCFKNEEHALQVFEKELKANLPELQKHGLFFSFTTDPYLTETFNTYEMAAYISYLNNVNVFFLSKSTKFINYIMKAHGCDVKIAYGFSLTGHDELEPGASTNAERIEAMKKLHNKGFKTWASIEPVINFESSKSIIRQTASYCDLYKIGLESKKKYDKTELLKFIEYCNSTYLTEYKCGFYTTKNYFKDSLLKQAGISRSDLPANCVTRDYNIFNG